MTQKSNPMMNDMVLLSGRCATQKEILGHYRTALITQQLANARADRIAVEVILTPRAPSRTRIYTLAATAATTRIAGWSPPLPENPIAPKYELPPHRTHFFSMEFYCIF